MSVLVLNLAGSQSHRVFFVLVLLVAAERLGELLLSRHNASKLLSRGGVESGRRHYPWMVGLHSAFLLACALEVAWASAPFYPLLAALAGTGLAGTMTLRYWAIFTLAGRWSTRIISLPGEAMVRHGPYRLLRHPNYVAVGLEIIFLPLIHTAWRTALLFGMANLVLLGVRIRSEEKALTRTSDYARVLGSLPRFIPARPGKHRTP